ncbi:xanthine dehydrogenase accessory protein XdhC [Pseudobacteriovorax antillogorgiicola]|uniref:Xanthine dehydrogenase accessory factor n=1 Tax=Pseudobacteriovorax antillogorgiicola TaxID=1513793 RepID=A0A1Y6C531_9BACT|nr:xanthine dehydrogenase accessory protein XdhC [Pseudobacteriovorax antillogorgiicola]TCS49770.1 xanthine dehydrogenase accessory factor [Pseudobacteriovorax antillogorgiicola]SMF42733.1 xanthine dehydrogenase accessory factor [Pseudobacteriovorax antillogorgiicola]
MLETQRKLLRLLEDQVDCIEVTVTDVRVSAPQNVGAKMLVTRNGLVAGTIGGGQLEAHGLRHAQSMLADEFIGSQALTWNLKKDLGMTCGGIVSLFFESHRTRSWPIAIFGAGHVAQAVVRCLLPLNCQITCFDDRQEWLDAMPRAENLLLRNLSLSYEQIFSDLPQQCFVLAMTKGHKFDFPVLKLALSQNDRFPFVGVLGSRSKAVVLKRELLGAGVTEQQCQQLVCPLGLDIGSRDPAEIAISIAAQLIYRKDRLQADRATEHNRRSRNGDGAELWTAPPD